jgi:small subunit ribosomal protein S17
MAEEDIKNEDLKEDITNEEPKQREFKTEERRRHRKTLEGVVVSNRMQKSVVVRVQRQVRHPLYGKILRKSSKYMAHDEENKCRVGDRVQISETRPLSKRKSWRVVSIISTQQT